MIRHPLPSKLQFVQTVAFGLISGTMFWGLPYTAEGLRDRFGALYWITTYSSLFAVTTTTLMFPQQRLLFQRERDANMYYTTTYLFAKTIIQIFEQMLFIFIYSVICYWMIGCDSTFLEFYITLLLNTFAVGSIGLIFGCFANNVSEATTLLPIIFAPLTLFSNFLVSIDQIPVWIRWLQWIDPFMFAVDALSITEFAGHLEGCKDDESPLCLYDGDEFLLQIAAGYDDTYWIKQWIHTWMDSVHFDWICMALCIIGYRLIVWLILVRRNGF